MSDNSLERQIQKMMEGLEFKPEAAVWEKVKAEIAPAKKKPLLNWRFPLLLLLLAGVSTGIWMLWNNNTPGTLTAQKDNTTYNNDTTTTSNGAAAFNQDGTANPKGIADPNGPVPSPETARPDGTVHSAETARPDGTVLQDGITNSLAETDKSNIKQSTPNNGGTKQKSADSWDLTGSNATAKAGLTVTTTTGTPLVKTQASGKTRTFAETQKLAPKTNNALNARSKQQQWAANKAENNEEYNQAPENSAIGDRSSLSYQVETDIVAVARPQVLASGTVPKLTRSQQQQFGQHALVNNPVIVRAQRNSDWHFMPFLAGGIVKINGDNDGGISTYEKAYYDNLNASFAPTAGAPVAVRAVVNYDTKVKTGKAYSIGFLADHKLIGKLSFQTGLRYQYISYSTFTVINTDSIGRFGNGYASLSASTVSDDYNYRMHYLGIPVFLHYDLTNPVGITAGVINDFMVGANKDGTSLQGAMKVWNPNAYFAFVINIPGSEKLQWKIMPYLQYGLKPLSKTGNQRLLQPGLQLSLQLNNK